jgi:tetratricopeptide (TPR) repeat protein
MALLYRQLGDDTQALVYLKQASEFMTRIADNTGAAKIHNLIGEIQEKLKQPDQALISYQKAIELAKLANDQNNLTAALNNLATLYYAQGEYSQALQTWKEALAILEKTGNQKAAQETQLRINELEKKQGG